MSYFLLRPGGPELPKDDKTCDSYRTAFSIGLRKQLTFLEDRESNVSGQISPVKKVQFGMMFTETVIKSQKTSDPNHLLPCMNYRK
jgi:hypothetical protein